MHAPGILNIPYLTLSLYPFCLQVHKQIRHSSTSTSCGDASEDGDELLCCCWVTHPPCSVRFCYSQSGLWRWHWTGIICSGSKNNKTTTAIRTTCMDGWTDEEETHELVGWTMHSWELWWMVDSGSAHSPPSWLTAVLCDRHFATTQVFAVVTAVSFMNSSNRVFF